MKVEFKVVLVCWFLILSIFTFDQGKHNEKTVLGMRSECQAKMFTYRNNVYGNHSVVVLAN